MTRLLLVFFLVVCVFLNAAVDDEYTVVLFHFDNNIIDQSGKSWSGAVTATTTSKFGGYSAFFNGTSNYITASHTDDFRFEGDFTIDFWMKLLATPTQYMNVLSSIDENGDIPYWMLWFDNEIGRIGIALSSAESNIIESTTSFVNESWNHIAISRSGTSVRLFLNGILNNGTSTNAVLSAVGVQEFRIGKQMNAHPRYFYGYIDELRISKGIARWTANFTPPTEPYGSTQSDIALGINLSADSIINFSENGTIMFRSN